MQIQPDVVNTNVTAEKGIANMEEVLSDFIEPFLNNSALHTEVSNLYVEKESNFINKYTPLIIKLGREDVVSNYYEGDYGVGLFIDCMVKLLMVMLSIIMFSNIWVAGAFFAIFVGVVFKNFWILKKRNHIEKKVIKKSKENLFAILNDFSLAFSSSYFQGTSERKKEILLNVVKNYYTEDGKEKITQYYASLMKDVMYNFQKNKKTGSDGKQFLLKILEDELADKEKFKENVAKHIREQDMQIINKVLK